VSRGQFLTTCGAALLGAGVDARSPVAPLFDLVREIEHIAPRDFRSHVSTIFSVRSPGRAPQSLRLTHVDDRSVEGVEQFSVLFQGAASTRLADGTYEFHHPALGRLDLFIVLVGRPSGGSVTYEACFTRYPEADRNHVLR
jgi:hypothetical protein